MTTRDDPTPAGERDGYGHDDGPPLTKWRCDHRDEQRNYSLTTGPWFRVTCGTCDVVAMVPAVGWVEPSLRDTGSGDRDAVSEERR